MKSSYIGLHEEVICSVRKQYDTTFASQKLLYRAVQLVAHAPSGAFWISFAFCISVWLIAGNLFQVYSSSYITSSSLMLKKSTVSTCRYQILVPILQCTVHLDHVWVPLLRFFIFLSKWIAHDSWIFSSRLKWWSALLFAFQVLSTYIVIQSERSRADPVSETESWKALRRMTWL